jgi:hypothetical protein
MRSIFAGLVVLLSGVLSGPVQAQGSSALLFVPNQYAPLSAYQEKAAPGPQLLSFAVRSELISFVVAGGYPGWVARQDAGGAVSFLQVSEVDAVAGVVRLSTELTGRFVVVAEPFTNDFPVVTHWNQGLNFGRGGFEAGAADPLGQMDFDPATGFVMQSTSIYDEDPASPHVYNTTQYALFSGDPAEPEALVPGYERYVGENYAIHKLTDRMATYLSLRAVEQTGFPLLHRNHPWAFWPEAPASRRAAENLPAFQMTHAVVMGMEPDKSSLATFVLPPFWVREPGTRYPVAFAGFYDVNETVNMHGADFVGAIGDLHNQGHGGAVGILWNGGGARGAYTVQWSAQLNVAWTFEWASIMLGIDKQKVVTTGLSRGGITALAVAANPWYDNYRVRYALAYCPAMRWGEHISQWANSTYPGLPLAYGWGTGYKYAHRASFIEPGSGLTGAQLFLRNAKDTTDPALVDAWSLDGDWLLDTLRDKGTSVLIAAGTHDGSMPLRFAQEYYDHLVARGVAVELDIGHRFGHSYFTDQAGRIFWALKEMATGSNTPLSGVRHFRRAGEGLPTQWQTPEEFTAERPFVLEFPSYVYRGQTARSSIVAQPGTMYALVVQKIDDAAWAQGQVVGIGDVYTVTLDIIPGQGPLGNQTKDFPITNDWPLGRYLFAAWVNYDGSNWEMTDLSKVPHPYWPAISVFEVKASEPTEHYLTLYNTYNISGRGWGLGSY